MNKTIESTIQRTRQYWYIDGFIEMLTGLVLLLLGAINYLSGVIHPSMGSAIMVGIGYPLIILGGTFAGRTWVRFLKEKITYPRTGYVQYIQPERSSRVKRAITAGLIAFGVSIVTMVIARDMDPFWVVLGTGLLIAAFIAYLGIQIPLNRFFILAIWVVVISLISANIPAPEEFQLGILLGGSGLGWLAGGGITLLHYLRSTQPLHTGMGEEE